MMRSKAYILSVGENSQIRIEDFRRKYSTIDFYLRGLDKIRAINYNRDRFRKLLRPIEFNILDPSKEQLIDNTLRRYGAVQIMKLKIIEKRPDTPPNPEIEYPSYLILEF